MVMDGKDRLTELAYAILAAVVVGAILGSVVFDFLEPVLWVELPE